MLVRFDMRAKHALLVRWRERHGLNQAAAGLAAGVSQGRWSTVECLRFQDVSYRVLEAIAQLLDVAVTEICPEEVFRSNLNVRWSLEREISAGHLLEAGQQARSMLPAPVDVMIRREEVEHLLEVMKKTLTYREREIIKLRYGIGGDGYTYMLEEVGRIFKVTDERVRQIEARALQKLYQKLGQPPQDAAVDAAGGRQSSGSQETGPRALEP